MFGRRRSFVAVVATASALLTPLVFAAVRSDASTPTPSNGYTLRTSVADDGSELTDWSESPQISGDGKWQVFATDSANPDPDPIVASDSYTQEVYVRNLDPNAPAGYRTVQISIGSSDFGGLTPSDPVHPDGASPDEYSFAPSISADGRYVSFITDATNIVPSDNSISLVVCDRDPSGARDAQGNLIFDHIIAGGAPGTQTRDILCYDVPTGGYAQSNAYSDERPRLSGDGTHIVWNDSSSAYVSKVSNGSGLVRPSAPQAVPQPGVDPPAAESEPVLNYSGNIVAWTATFDDGTTGIMRTTLGTTPTLKRLDVAPAGVAFTGFIGDQTPSCGGGSGTCPYQLSYPTITDSGDRVLFHIFGYGPLGETEVLANVGYSVATEIVSRDNGGPNDPVGQQIVSYGGVISGDGRFVAFQTESPNTHDGADGLGEWAIVARDLDRDRQRLYQGLSRLPGAIVTVNANQDCPDLAPPAVINCTSSDNGDFIISMDGNGSRIAFSAAACDLIPGDCSYTGDTNGEDDTFVRTWQPTLSNSPVDLGDVPAGDSTVVSIPVKVSGFGPIRFGDVTVTGGAGEFSVDGTNCYPSDTFYGDGSCNIAIRLAPGQQWGSRQAAVFIQADAYAEPQQVATLQANVVPGALQHAPGDTTRTSVRSGGGQSPLGGDQSMISGNGRWQVFVSDSNLAGHTPISADFRISNVFVRDLADPQRTLQISLHTNVTPQTPVDVPSHTIAVPKHPTGASPDSDSFQPSISSDGRFVSFFTQASDIVPMPPLQLQEDPQYVLVVCDRDPTNTQDSAGTPVLDLPRKGTLVPNYACYPIESGGWFVDSPGVDTASTPRLSGDGTRIAWVENRDSAEQRVKVATLSRRGGPLHEPIDVEYVPSDVSGYLNVSGTADARSGETVDQVDPTLTENGDGVVYVAGDCSRFSTCPSTAVIETDLTATSPDTTSFRLDTVDNGSSFLGDQGGWFDAPSVSDEGSRVAFAFGAEGDVFSKVYVATLTGSAIETNLESRNNNGDISAGAQPALSGDGRYLAFRSGLPNEHNGIDPPRGSCITGGNVYCQIVARDLRKDVAFFAGDQPWNPSELVSSSIATDCVATLPAGRQCAGNDSARNPSIDATGSEIGFDTEATDIVPGDTNDDPNPCEGSPCPAVDSFVHTWRPTLTAAPGFDFGSLLLGAHRDRLFTVTESGFGPLSLAGVSVGGSNAADFPVLGTTCRGKTLNDTQTCTMRLRFAPAAKGVRSGELSIPVGSNGYPRHNADNTISYDPALLVGLTGVGKATAPVLVGDLTTDPSTLEFGSGLPLAPGVTKTVTVTNTGTGPLDITGVAAQDTTHAGSSGDYTITTDCLGTLLPGDSCTVEVTFVGSKVGRRDAQLVITDDTGTPTTVDLVARIAKPTVLANPGVTSPGRVTTIFGTGFAPGQLVDVALKGLAEQATVLADNKGEFEVTVVIFRNTPEGPQTVTGHTQGASPSIGAEGPLLIAHGTVDDLGLVTRH